MFRPDNLPPSFRLSAAAISAACAMVLSACTSTPPQAVATPSSVDTRIGKIELQSGYPSEASVRKLYDEMDFQRAVQAYIWAMPIVAFDAFASQTPATGVSTTTASESSTNSRVPRSSP